MVANSSLTWKLSFAERRGILIIGDFFVGLAALGISLIVWAANAEWLGFSFEFLSERVEIWFFFLPLVWLLLLVDMRDVHKSSNWRKTIRGVMISTLIGFMLYSVVYIFSEPGSLPRLGVASFLLAAFILTLGWRWIYIKIFTAPQFLRRVLLVGGGNAGQLILRAINRQQPRPFHLIEIIDDDPQKRDHTIEGYKVIAGSDELLD